VTTGAAADTFHSFHSFDNPGNGIRATLAAWAAANPSIHVDSVGASYEGRPILAVKIGPPDDSPTRPNVLFLGTHHAREWISTAVAMKLIRWLADSGGALINAYDIWVIPVENPDGYQYTFTADRYWRKNRRPNAGGSYGVDPNRNYPAFWGVDDAGSSGNENAETYRGTTPASEPETQSVMAFHAAHPPVVSISFHSYSGLVLYPWGFRAGQLPPDLPRFEALAGTDLVPAVPDSLPGSSLDHYHPGPGWNLYTTNGEYTDWAYRTYGTIAFTTELTSGCCVNGVYYGFEFPDDSVLVERVFRDNLPFARALIVASGDLAHAPGVTGTVPAPPRFESLWPDSWLSLDTGEPRPLLTLRTAAGALTTRSSQTDSLRRGTLRTVWRTDLRLDGVRALRAEGTAITAELLSLGGAEPLDAGWQGWHHDSVRVGGSYSWATAGSDTLTSTYSWSDCIAYTYYGAKVNYNCPAGPCYQQWYNMRSAGWDFTGKINAFLTGALMLRNRWGLFATTLPAGTIITGNYLTLDLRQKQFLQCIHERDNWVFYNNDAPNTWIVPGMPK